MDAYTLVCCTLLVAVVARQVWMALVDSYVCNVTQASHDATVAEMKLDAICSQTCDFEDLTELPFMESVERKRLWRVLDEFELQAQLILGEAALPEICKD